MGGHDTWVLYPAGATAFCVVGFFVVGIFRRMASPVRKGWVSTVFASLLSAFGIGAFYFGGAGDLLVLIAPLVVLASIAMTALTAVRDEIRWPPGRDRR